MPTKLCIVIPAFNEQAAIASTIVEYKAVFPEAVLVVIDNNSSDGTAAEIKRVLDPKQDHYLFERRQGKGMAIKTGLSRISADVYIMTDGDATYPAKDARQLYEQLLDMRADMLVGDRVTSGSYDRQNTRPGHGVGNRLLTAVISQLSGQKYNDVLSGLRIMSRPFVSMLDVRSSGFQLETELNVIAAHLRADVVEVPIDYRERGHGSESKLSTIGDGFRILYFALVNWIAFLPMHAFSIVAFFTLAGALALGLRVFQVFLAEGMMPYPSTAVAAVSLGLVGTMSLFTGLTLRITQRSSRRQDIAAFLEAKRAWNDRMDRSIHDGSALASLSGER